MDPTPILHGTIAALAFVVLAHRPWSSAPLGLAGAVLLGLGFGVAHVLGWVALNGAPPLAPTTAAQWLLYLVPAAALVTVAERRPSGVAAVTLLRLVLVSAFLALNLGPVAEYREWSGREYALHFAALVATGIWTMQVAGWLADRSGDPSQDEESDRGGGLAPCLSLMVWGGLCAGLLGTTSSVSALTLGGMNTFFGVGCVVALIRPGKALWSGVVAPFTFAAWALLFIATFYGAVEELPAGLMLLAPLGGVIPLGSLAGIRLAVVRVLLIGLVGGLALYLGWPEPSPYY